jgi:hypothetical protein
VWGCSRDSRQIGSLSSRGDPDVVLVGGEGSLVAVNGSGLPRSTTISDPICTNKSVGVTTGHAAPASTRWTTEQNAAAEPGHTRSEIAGSLAYPSHRRCSPGKTGRC